MTEQSNPDPYREALLRRIRPWNRDLGDSEIPWFPPEKEWIKSDAFEEALRLYDQHKEEWRGRTK